MNDENDLKDHLGKFFDVNRRKQIPKELFMELPKYLEQILQRICQAKRSNHEIQKKTKEMVSELELGNRVYALKKVFTDLNKPGESGTRSSIQSSEELEPNH